MSVMAESSTRRLPGESKSHNCKTALSLGYLKHIFLPLYFLQTRVFLNDLCVKTIKSL